MAVADDHANDRCKVIFQLRLTLCFPVYFVNRYVDNICKNPTEEKYRRIKLSNKVFQVILHHRPANIYDIE